MRSVPPCPASSTSFAHAASAAHDGAPGHRIMHRARRRALICGALEEGRRGAILCRNDAQVARIKATGARTFLLNINNKNIIAHIHTRPCARHPHERMAEKPLGHVVTPSPTRTHSRIAGAASPNKMRIIRFPTRPLLQHCKRGGRTLNAHLATTHTLSIPPHTRRLASSPALRVRV